MRTSALVPLLASVTIAALAALPGTPSAAEGGPGDAAEAYDISDGESYRQAITRELLDYRTLETEALDAELGAVIDLAAERGAQGLEPLLVSGLDELGSRGVEGEAMAQGRLSALGEVYWIDSEKVRPNAVAPVSHAASPALHHLPVYTVGVGLQGQLAGGLLDPNAGLYAGLCTEAGMAAFEARFGADLAGLLSELCDQTGSGHYGGDLGLQGMMGGLSTFDCLSAHEPTRAERLTSAMWDCMQSMVPAGGDPLAEGNKNAGRWDMVTGRTYFIERSYEVDPQTGEEVLSGAIATDLWHKTVFTQDFHADGSSMAEYYNDNGDVYLEIDYDADGNMTAGRAIDKNGTRTEEVINHADGSYTVTQYDSNGNATGTQTYNADGQPIDANGSVVSDGLGGDWGDTDECRQFNLMLVEERFEMRADEAGVRPEVVNPDPTSPVPGEEEEDCLQFSGSIVHTRSMDCNDDLVHCALGQTLDENCQCQDEITGVAPARLCSLMMTCADGATPIDDGGICVCPDGEVPVILDGSVGGGPGPDPAGPPDPTGGF